VSKQDSQFFTLFSAVIGLLVAITLVLMALARSVGANTQLQQVVTDQRYVQAVEERIRPLVHVAVAGQDNSALAIKDTTPGGSTAFALPVPKDGNELYTAVCQACHQAGIGGAPKAGDKSAWAPRIAQGNATLYKHAIEGYNGKAGVMPAKGGRADLADDLIKAGVDHLVGMAK
jgi:cytochrome c5